MSASTFKTVKQSINVRALQFLIMCWNNIFKKSDELLFPEVSVKVCYTRIIKFLAFQAVSVQKVVHSF